MATLPRFERGLPESKSGVLTITLKGNILLYYKFLFLSRRDWYLWSDSNRQLTDFKSVAATSWAT